MTREQRDSLRREWRAGFASASPRVQAMYDAVPLLLDALDAAEASAEVMRQALRRTCDVSRDSEVCREHACYGVIDKIGALAAVSCPTHLERLMASEKGVRFFTYNETTDRALQQPPKA